MNKKRGKKYNEVVKLIDQEKLYEISEAMSLLQKTSVVKFDASVDVAFHLNINTKHAEQQIRGAVVLPNGTGKTKKVLVVTTNENEAKEAGADFFGGKEIIEKIKKDNWFEYDVIVATPEMMGELGKIGKLLGPKGLMPNPKLGTVTTDIKNAVEEIKKGKANYRADKEGNIHVNIGKLSFGEKKLIENFETIKEVMLKARPSVVKGKYIKNVVITTTMGPSIKIQVN